ncbi:Fanconi anemia group D2 protein homolog [Drosophila guanche]|uniref:Blast:Fanconi anemia group D2 protein n=1 Tax=Drosophila guanche TaxID=7266 RepID=A0A3B0K502_DROGU|nr:Fanconi anemia group D2 protein homolog [Drosophila guanche]SPP83080.1 blast:Fanconi anemia group D2 protein [Drosophila guanche]
MYRKYKKRGQKPLVSIDEDKSIKIPRPADKEAGDITDVSVASTTSGSEENIPASQEHTQRFLSQHSAILAATLGRTQSSSRNQLSLSRQPNNFFELVLIRAGVQLDQGDTLVLSCDHVSIVSKLRDMFMSAPSYADKLETFKSGLNTAMAPKSKLSQKLLTGCTVDAAGEEQIYQSQNSMFMNFLMIDFMRDPCLEVLLDRMEEVATSDQVITGQGAIPMPLLPLMLAQMRYLTLSHKEQIYKRIEVVFNRATDSSKLDIINNAEFVLDASMHDAFVELLFINYSCSEELFNMTTVHTLSNLSLSAKTQDMLRLRILEFTTSGACPDTTLPHLIRLLLNSLKLDTDDSVRELVSTLREIFNCRHRALNESGAPTANDKKSQLDLFGFLELGLIRSKRFYQLWQRLIATLPADGFTALDLIMILLLIHVNEDNSLYIENILRRRIKQNHITVHILEDVKLHYPHILEQNISTLMHILHDFMCEKNAAVAEFAKSSYSVLFTIFTSIQKNILRKLLELACDKSSQHLTTMALHLLRELLRKSFKDVQNCAPLFLPMLDRLSDLTLPQTRLAMEVLCNLAFPEPKLPESLQLQEQVEMVVKKQLINRTDYVKKQGIIGSVQLINAIACTEEHSLDDGSQDFSPVVDSIDGLPDGRPKVAANLIILTESSIINSAESLALFYEELATVISQRCPISSYWNDKYFTMWLCELMTFRFQQSFVTEDSPKPMKGIYLEYQKNINELDESNINSEAEVLSIGINISKLVLMPKNEASESIYVMTPLFYLVRMLHQNSYRGSLELINALLGCAIVLPAFFEDDSYVAIFDNYDEEQQKHILSIYFHTINWIRVTISAFAAQIHRGTRERVLLRLGELISIEQRIKALLTHAPDDFVAPPYQFLDHSKQKVTMHKRQGGMHKAHETPLTEDDICNQTTLGDFTLKVAPCKTTNKTKIDFEELYGPQERYRPMDVRILVLLEKQELSLNYPLDDKEKGKALGLLELRFLLEDVVQKLKATVHDQQDSLDSVFLHPHRVSPESFIHDISKSMPDLNNHLKVLAAAIDEELVKVNYVYSNLDLFKERFNYIKTCFGLAIQYFALYFSWSGWSDESNAKELHESLYILQSSHLPAQEVSKSKKQTTTQLATWNFDYFVKYEKSVLNLSTAVQLHRLLCSLRKLAAAGDDANQTSLRLAEDTHVLCDKLLRRKWFHFSSSLHKGAQCNIYLDELVKGLLKHSTFARQKELLNELIKECTILNTKDKALNSFPNFKKANFPLLFRGLCEVLIHSLNAQVTAEKEGDRLRVWESTVNMLNGLLKIVQLVEQPRNFGLFLKHSQHFLKLLLLRGMSVLETIVRDDPERITKFLQELQKVTRFLHQLCCHSKSIKNTAIISYIPSLRETIETLVFRVKALLAANNCHSAFHMGNMINRDLHGDSIITPVGSFISEENSDEELPADDTSVDETVLDGPTGIGNISSSTRPSTSGSRSKSSSRSKCF